MLGKSKSVTIQQPNTPDDKKTTGDKTNAIPVLNREASVKTPTVHKYALKALNSGIADAIVSIRVSTTEQQEADLSRNGYVQLLQEETKPQNKKTNVTTGSSTFGNRASLWTWSRGQGTCSGRLKPIIDVQLDSSSSSSDLVLSGYVCDPVQIAGQWFWVKRAVSEEEEKDAIVDFFVTTGKMKDTSDPVWTSPGVGWIRVDGNFSKSMFGSIDSILWFRPARTRSLDSHMTSPIRSSVALTEEVRQTKLLSATRLALRHFVPVQDMKRLANLVMETSNTGNANSINTNIVRSERMLDFSYLFHEYGVKGKLTLVKLSKMLVDIGIRMSRADITHCFNYFDANHGGFVSIEDYTKTLSLTDYELDLAVEKIRVKLLSTSSNPAAGGFSKAAARLSAGVSKPSLGVLGAGSITAHANMGRNKIRENLTMIHVFNAINVKKDSILSLDEVMDLASKVEVFLTEEEARKVLLMMDMNGDDRVEEADFVAFMRKESDCIVKKAYRVREAAALLRRWLIRGTSEKITSTATATASKQQWKAFKRQYEKSTVQKFPGYLSASVLVMTMATLGLRLSAIEARELTLLMAPEKNGRIHQSDLHAFMGRTCRSFGELMAVLERDILRDLFDAYRAHNLAVRATGKEDIDLADLYRKKLEATKTAVEMVFNKPPPAVKEEKEDHDDDEVAPPVPAPKPVAPEPKHRKASHEVISIAQLKAGVEDMFKDANLPEGVLLNLEEWASLSVLVDADVADGDIYGVKLKIFLEGLCAYAVSSAEEQKHRAGEKVSLEIVSRELKRQIYTEARANGKAKKPDYKMVFDLFDMDRSGAISLEELKVMLRRLQLVNSLPDHQVPSLLAMFDKSKRGSINQDDFIAFAEDFAKNGGDERGPDGELRRGGLDGEDDEGGELDDEEDEDDLEAMTSNVPPVSITRNADCDWMLWMLYRQACKVEPTDPESVITELEATCSETELIVRNQPSISVKEFWNLLFEKRLQGAMSKSQYIKGVQFVCSEGNGRDDDRVDHETLCKYIVRMGRGFNQLVQERAKHDEGKFFPLVADLKKYFKELSEERPADKTERNQSGPARYEKLFRRLDGDGDGMLTMREFKLGLRKLRFKDEKSWTMRMVRRLFDECDKNRDGLLSIKEFNLYILDSQGPSKLSIARNVSQQEARSGTPGRDSRDPRAAGLKEQEDKLNLSDDEEDQVFRKHKVLTDHELIRKVNEVLHDIVPVEDNPQVRHSETVRNSVRRFFQRADPDYKGYVSEERFRAFLRRSTLQDSLTTSELRRLTDKLKKRGADRTEICVDYEKLIQLLNVAVESIPKSKAEIVFARFQDAAIASADAGRPFLSLCSLVDLRLSGRITKDELIVTAKMMDCPLTNYDVEAMLELLPNSAISKDNLIDYRQVHNLIQSFTPRATMNQYDLDPHRSGALPAYATPGSTLANIRMNDNGNRFMNKSINSPLGGTLTTPFQAYNDSLSNRPGGIQHANASVHLINGRAGHNLLLDSNTPSGSRAYEQSARLLIERVKLAVEEASSRFNSPVSIRLQFEAYDNDNSGLIGTRTLQAVLDDIGVTLTAADLQSIYHLYGRPEDDKIYYDSFCRALDNSHPLQPNDNRRPGTAPAALSSTESFVPYLSAKVLQRVRELRSESRDPRDIFEGIDLDRSGLVSTLKFKEVVVKLQLLTTEHQLLKAIEDFTSINNRSFVMYEEFCFALEKALASNDNSLRTSTIRKSGTGGFVNGSGFDGTARSGTQRNGSIFGGDNDEPTNVYDSLRSFRAENTYTPSHHVMRDYPLELDEGSAAYDYPLSPPKVSESLNFGRHTRRSNNDGIASWAMGSPARHGGSSPNRYSRNVSYGEESPRRSTSSIAPPRTSPSKMGSRIWGSHTPLSKKGNVPRMGEDKWCCAVCLYVENPNNSNHCAVCDSPNYTNTKEYQLKEQCANCTYLNGQFAEECEMCGEPLSKHNFHSARRDSGASGYHVQGAPESHFKIRDGTNRGGFSSSTRGSSSSRDYY